MAASFQPADDAPMSELNTTPLIDVMLVLLIMFIITIPISSHKVPLEIPEGKTGPEPAIHRLTLDEAGRTFWDGEAIGPQALTARLAAHVADPAAPLLQLSAAAETRYERFDEVLAAVRRAGVGNLVLDNVRYAGALNGG